MKFLRSVLFPFSLLYGLMAYFRNLLYDFGIIKSQSFEVPIISVGNLCLGGTGKSPHIEYLIKLLQEGNKVAVLSRGYGRTSKGFISASKESDAFEIGDEPKQFKEKFPETEVAVDVNRIRGIRKILRKISRINVILLDDAFQHRHVKPGLSVLLTDYSKLFVDDFPVPYGSLREWKSGSSRADIIVVTRIPEYFSPMEKRIIRDNIKPKPYQKIYFSNIHYGDFIPLNRNKEHSKGNLTKEFYFERDFSVLLVTGIANPAPLSYYLKNKVKDLRHIKFRDHHRYSVSDINGLKKIFNNIATENKIILTTEKDAMRLGLPAFQKIVNDLPIFYIPIEIGFHEKDQEEFNEQIINYVRKNQVNSRVHKKQS